MADQALDMAAEKQFTPLGALEICDFHLLLPVELYDRLGAFSAARFSSMAEVVRTALGDYLDAAESRRRGAP